MSRTLIIGTRGSELALWQANYTKSLLEKKGYTVELKIITTQGDKSQQWNTSFDKLEGKGFFTKELEEELLANTIDLAVHSHKDLPTTSPDGLIIAGVSEREDPSDVLLIRKEAVDEAKKFSLKTNATVGTSSARRKSQLLAFRPDVTTTDLRGNVPTRIAKLRNGEYDAILLAVAGIERLEIDTDDLHVEKLDVKEFIPAPAQGVLAWQIREDDYQLLDIIDQLNDFDVLINISIERRILNLLDGGCHLPLGAYCETDTDDNDRRLFKVWVSVADAWDQQPKQLFFEAYNTEELPETIVEKIQTIQPQTVFVTRHLKEEDYLMRSLSRLNFTVESKSLIEFKPIAIKYLPEVNWMFFSSKHAVRYFFSQEPQLVGTVKIGCIGKSTAQELRAFGKRADFIGQNTDTKLIGKQFASLIGNSRVLFPIAKDSLQSIQYQIRADNVFNLPVYWTVKHPHTVSESTNIVVFTSPSNVEAYFETNKWMPHQKAVAMGDATAAALVKQKITAIANIAKPTTFDDFGLVQAILSLS